MKVPRLRIDFSRLSDADLEIKAQAIHSAMSAAASFFPTPTPPLAALDGAITVYSDRLARAKTRDKSQVALKNEARLNLEQMLITLSGYVMNTANGDEAKLVASGFDLVKPATNLPPIGIPENFSVINGINEGEIVSSVDRVNGAKSYIHEYTVDPVTPGSSWTQEFTTVRKLTIANLDPGKKYWFRVAAIGPRQQITYTNPQMRMVA